MPTIVAADAKLELNHAFPNTLSRRNYALVPVVTPQGLVKVLKVKPGHEPTAWLICEWDKVGARFTRLISVRLTTERIKAGCTFLQVAYEAEGFRDGWKSYEDFLRAQFEVESRDKDGNSIRVPRERAVDVGHFPDHLLPKSVLAKRGGAKKEKVQWEPKEGVAHPDDRPRPTAGEIDSSKKSKGS